jgi:hypothetical protein
VVAEAAKAGIEMAAKAVAGEVGAAAVKAVAGIFTSSSAGW